MTAVQNFPSFLGTTEYSSLQKKGSPKAYRHLEKTSIIVDTDS